MSGNSRCQLRPCPQLEAAVLKWGQEHVRKDNSNPPSLFLHPDVKSHVVLANVNITSVLHPYQATQQRGQIPAIQISHRGLFTRHLLAYLRAVSLNHKGTDTPLPTYHSVATALCTASAKDDLKKLYAVDLCGQAPICYGRNCERAFFESHILPGQSVSRPFRVLMSTFSYPRC